MRLLLPVVAARMRLSSDYGSLAEWKLSPDDSYIMSLG